MPLSPVAPGGDGAFTNTGRQSPANATKLRQLDATMTQMLDDAGQRFQPWFLLLVRVAWGLAFVDSGYRKLVHWPSINYCSVDYFRELGIPLPAVVLPAMALTHIAGGLCWIAGLRVRMASVALGVTMVAAYLIAHRDTLTDWSLFVKADPCTYLIVCCALLCWGPGAFSLERRWRQPQQPAALAMPGTVGADGVRAL